jgi:hypothetical protein
MAFSAALFLWAGKLSIMLIDCDNQRWPFGVCGARRAILGDRP